jgi:DNA polymerase
MVLELDRRQRAMLKEMGVPVWLPESGVAILERETAAATPASSAAAAPLARLAPNAVPPAPPAPGTAQRPGTFVAAGQAAAAALAGTAAGNPLAPVGPRGQPPHRAPDPGGHAHGGDAATTPGVSPDWSTLTESVRNCQACGLCGGRSHTTLLAPLDGGTCDWMLVGDPPDEEEDRAGVPFAGQAGVLLHNMLRALGLQRANPDPAAAPLAPAPGAAGSAATRAYVTNVLKCRPAHGAVPQAAELAQCAGHLQREIALVQPRMILAMGRFANQLLLAQAPELAALPLGKLRGTVHRYQGIAVVVTYPPKLLLRNSADKAKAWADLCLAATTLEA